MQEAINKLCPRSKKPVVKDSLCQYQTHNQDFVVGFCNTACRDDFVKNIKTCDYDRGYFDALIFEHIKQTR